MSNLLSIDRFDAALENKGWTLQALANEYDQKYPTDKGKTIYNTLRKWHCGESNPTLQKLLRICDLLECDIDYLLGRIDYHTHTSKIIHDQTGLNESSIEKLKSLYCRIPQNIESLDLLLSLSKFSDTLLASFYQYSAFAYKYYMNRRDDTMTYTDFMGKDIDWYQTLGAIKSEMTDTFRDILNETDSKALRKAESETDSALNEIEEIIRKL